MTPSKLPTYIRENEPLAPHTTLELGGPARYFAQVADERTLLDCLHWARGRGVPLEIMGGGSNLVVADEGFDGMVIKIALRGISIDRALPPRGATGSAAIVSAASGEPFDLVVETTVAADLAGLECLSGIPGLVGATPMQNVGAYGHEVADTIRAVRVLDRSSLRTEVFAPEACRFSYRDSLFKRDRDRYIVLAVGFALAVGGACTPGHEQLRQRLHMTPDDQAAGASSARVRPAQVREAVLALRRTKSMVLDPEDPNHRSVGSFFVNPVVSPALAAQVFALAVARGASARAEDVPRFPGPEGQVKLSAAWLIEHAGVLPGFALDNVGVSTNHVLALVNNGGGSTAELLALAVHVRDVVREAFGVVLEPEPAFLGFSAPPLTSVRC